MRIDAPWAAARGRVEAVDVLLRGGASPDVADANGRTAVHHAALTNCGGGPRQSSRGAGVDVIARLTMNGGGGGGAKVDARDDAGSTALHGASSRGHLAAAESLLAAGADPTAKDARRRG